MNLYFKTGSWIQIILLLPKTEGNSRSGPFIRPFFPMIQPLTSDCQESFSHACLEIPSRSVCRERMAQPLAHGAPLPWWYFYCQYLTKMKPPPKTSTVTINSYIKKDYQEFYKYRKSLKVGLKPSILGQLNDV